jgi:5'-nucleotidase
MKKLLGILLGLALGTWQLPASASSSAVVTLLHVNDTHHHLEAAGPRTAKLAGTEGGIAKAATLIGRVRARDPNALLLHAGDSFQGDPSFNIGYGTLELGLMAGLGFDAFTVGNHEFDFGPMVFDGALAAVPSFAPPLLSANLEIPPDDPGKEFAPTVLRDRIRPGIIKKVHGVKVGIFGLTVPDDLTMMPDPITISADIGPIAAKAIADLKAGGAEVVICLSHLGILGDRDLAANVPGIDVIVGGHDHFLFEKPVEVRNPEGKKTLILQAGAYWQHVGKLRFTVTNGAFRFVDYEMLHADSGVPPAPEMAAAVATIRDYFSGPFAGLFEPRLGTALYPLERSWDAYTGRRDTPLGNLLTDAYRNVTKTDVALTPLGLVAERIAEGPIVGLDVFRAVSYGFDQETGLGLRLATADITGGDLFMVLEIGVSQVETGDAIFPQTSGLVFRFDSSRPPFARVIPESVRVNGAPLDPARTYTLTVNEGVASLLVDSFGIPLGNVDVKPETWEYVVLSEEIARLGRVNYRSEGRIIDQSWRSGRRHASLEATESIPVSFTPEPDPNQ